MEIKSEKRRKERTNCGVRSKEEVLWKKGRKMRKKGWKNISKECGMRGMKETKRE